jgi:hypothetical protein
MEGMECYVLLFIPRRHYVSRFLSLHVGRREDRAIPPLWRMVLRGSMLTEDLEKPSFFLLFSEDKMLPSGIGTKTSMFPPGTGEVKV